MRPKSLHQELFQWLLASLFLLVLLDAWQSYVNADRIVGVATDRTLIGSAHAIAEQIKVSDGVIQAVIPPSALEMFASGYHDRVLYRVVDSEGILLAGYPDVPGPPKAEGNAEPVFFDAYFRDQPIRAVALVQRLLGDGGQQFALVIVGQTLRGHVQTVQELWFDEVKRQAALAVIAVILAWIGLNRGLAPLVRISAEIAERPADALDLIEEDRVQLELRPLVRALNHSVERVRRHIDEQRRFVADAAHQLRTPLAVMKSQTSRGLGGDGSDDKDKALLALDDSIEQMARVMNQLLVLARIEPDGTVRAVEGADLAAVTRHVLEQCADRSLAKSIDLSFDAPDEPVMVTGNETLLLQVALNLVDNAIRYVPSGGTIAVEVRGDGVLRVVDDGPGIPANQRSRVFDRFYRVLGTGVEGSGLGLAIVREIVLRFGGTVALQDPPSGRGLAVEVRLPISPGP